MMGTGKLFQNLEMLHLFFDISIAKNLHTGQNLKRIKAISQFKASVVSKIC